MAELNKLTTDGTAYRSRARSYRNVRIQKGKFQESFHDEDSCVRDAMLLPCLGR